MASRYARRSFGLVGIWVLLAAAALAAGVSVVHAQETGGVAASGTLNAKLTLTLGDTSMALGTPDPDCEGNTDGATVGEFTVYNGATGNQGCSYLWNGISVRVKSNKAWTGTIDGSDGSPTSAIKVVNSSFHYDSAAASTNYSTCADATAMATTSATWEPSGTVWNNLYTFYHCVIIDWDDTDGTIDSTITYTVTQ